MNILYFTNIEVPYKVRFLNELAKYCNLTVLYERKKSNNRDYQWAKSEKMNYKIEYLGGISIGNEYSFSLKVIPHLLHNYDWIVISCYNSPIQMFSMVFLHLFHIKYIISLDGEAFLDTSSKSYLKKFFLSGAKKYLTAGEKSRNNIKSSLKKDDVVAYYFSSLSRNDLNNNYEERNKNTNDTIIVIGQYFDYKGLDIAVEAARRIPYLNFKFIGMGNRTELFVKECNTDIISNIEICSFLDKQRLQYEYQNCLMMILPSRKECWGLTINEAASFGTPIVSTWGSGAAIEFLADEYPQFLATPGDPDSLCKCILELYEYDKLNDYSEYLLKKSKCYSIEKSVSIHVKVINE